MRTYFAYGANMVLAAMARRCPATRVLGPATLAHHRFAIIRGGHGTVLRQRGATVHGLLWRLGRGDRRALDRYEEVAAGLYRPERRLVEWRGRLVPALVYVARATAPGRARKRYLQDIIAAAAAFAFAPDYCAALAASARISAGATPAARSARSEGAPARLA